MKECKKCKKLKTLSNFYKSVSTYKGKVYCYYQSKCSKCTNKDREVYRKEYTKNNKDKVRKWDKEAKKRIRSNPEKVKKISLQKRASRERTLQHLLWKRAKSRALKKGYEFNLLEEDIIIPDKCPILNIPLFPGTKNNYKNSPTIDRINNSKGYTKDNIRIISMLANTMKNSASIEELKLFAQNILAYILVEDIV